MTRTLYSFVLAFIVLGPKPAIGGLVPATPLASLHLQDSKEEEAKALLATFSNPTAPGYAVAVLDRGKIVFKGGIGLANLEYEVPITPDTVFHVASVSKQFTCFAIALLESEAQLGFDDDIRDYLPEIPDFGETITIRHLMHHTSGLRDQWSLLTLAGWRMDDVITEDDVFELVCRQQDLNFAPGDRHMYCNTGYTLLAAIVKRVTGQSLREYTTERLFDALEMPNTYFHDDHRAIVKNRAYSYSRDSNESFRKSVLSYAVVGATSLFTSASDLMTWQDNFHHQTLGGTHVMDSMWTRGTLNSGHVLDYALGLVHGNYLGLSTISHSGGDAGFRSFLVRFPEQDFSVAVLSNLAESNPQGLAYRLSDIYLKGVKKSASVATNLFGDSPTHPEGVDGKWLDLDSDELGSHAGTYFNRDDGSLNTVEVDGSFLLFKERQGGSHRFAPIDMNVYVGSEGSEFPLTFLDKGLDKKHALWQSKSLGPQRLIRTSEFDVESVPELSGKYTSEELDESYFIEGTQGDSSGEESPYVLRRMKYGRTPIRPLARDVLQASSGEVLYFVRTEDGDVESFELSGGRIKKLRFEKQH